MLAGPAGTPAVHRASPLEVVGARQVPAILGAMSSDPSQPRLRRPRGRLLGPALALIAFGAWGCRTPAPRPEGPTDPGLREDPVLGLPVHKGSVLESLPEPERGLDGSGRR